MSTLVVIHRRLKSFLKLCRDSFFKQTTVTAKIAEQYIESNTTVKGTASDLP